LDTVSKLYREDKRFFFNVGDGNINSTEGIIRYLGRYLARSPVAEYKITEIDDDNVTFFFNDLANNKKKTYITIFRNITTKIVTNIEIRCLILLFIY